ncbi:MAG: hypothetical protein CVV51_08535 [Spirochaetae bacterium HGW-Spirochaetae-7]|jgi:hypothetical protein|nr:MAG: hypothetical protein CVV51_08535 [Spirochaetae bacterium HGW-Spirochaetae-7]
MKRFSKSMIASALALAATTVLFAPLRAYAQEPGGTDLAAFEADLFAGESGTSPAGFSTVPTSTFSDVARTDYLVGGTVVAQAVAYFTSDLDSMTALSDISGKLFAKVSVPDYGALYIAYNARHAFFQAHSGSGAPPVAVDPYSPAYELAELHYSFDVAKVLFVRIGNQLISWGPSRIWSPVDFINLQKADAFSSIDLRVGKPGLRLHMPLPRSNAFLFADFANLVKDGGGGLTYGDPLESVNIGGRYDFTAGSFEFGLTGYAGKNAQARFGLDASGRLLGMTVYGELALRPEYASYGYSAQASAGFSRTLDELKRWTLSAEGFYNQLPVYEQIPLYQGKFYAYAALSASELLSSSLSTTLSVISNLTDLSYSVKLAESFSFPRAVPFTLSVSFAGGGADKEFTRFAGDRAFSVSMSTRVEF